MITQISTITFRTGNLANIPQLDTGEFGWAIDTQQLYIGNGNISEGAPIVGNTLINSNVNGNVSNGNNVTYNNVHNTIFSNISSTINIDVLHVNNIAGNVSIIPGSFINISNTSSTITITSTGGSGNGSGNMTSNCSCAGQGCPIFITGVAGPDANIINLSPTGNSVTYLMNSIANGLRIMLPPAASMTGQFLKFKNIASGGQDIAVYQNGFYNSSYPQDLIEGNEDIGTFGAQYDYVVLQSDCTNTWYIWGEHITTD